MTNEGAPPPPKPWTTTDPREALRDNSAGRILSLTPTECSDQVGNCSVPTFANLVDFCSHDIDYTPSVCFTGQKALVLRSKTQHVHGGGGGGVCEPISHAQQVFAEGSPVVRHGDEFWMDNRKTKGEASFQRSTACYTAPDDRDPMPGSVKTSDEGDASYGAWAQQIADHRVVTDEDPAPVTPAVAGQQYAQAGAAEGDLMEPAPAPPPSYPLPESLRPTPAVPATPEGGRLDPTLGGGAAQPAPSAAQPDFFRDYQSQYSAGEYYTDLPEPLGYVRPLVNGQFMVSGGEIVDRRDIDDMYADIVAERKRNRESASARTPGTATLPATPQSITGARIDPASQPSKRIDCLVGEYKTILAACTEEGGETHHIIPDVVYRLGRRPDSVAAENSTTNRIPRAPTFNQGQSICLTTGQHRTDEEAVHKSLNPAINELGKLPGATVVGTAPIGDIEKSSENAIDRIEGLSSECKQRAKNAALDQALPLLDHPGRATVYRTPKQPALRVLKRGSY